jgi:peptidoglycan/LPS O-acetylase OafA/YrhL
MRNILFAARGSVEKNPVQKPMPVGNYRELPDIYSMTAEKPTAIKKVYTLNALRGFSAVFVVFFHMVAYGKYLDPDYLPRSFQYFHNKSQLRVLIFFIISGAVISLSNKMGITAANLPTYVRKRVTRIYPIYVIGLLLAILVSEKADSLATIAGNAGFLHVLFSDVISGNGPVWTLHYEIVFYLLFIPLSMLEVDPLKLLVLALLLGFVNFFLSPYLHTPIITSYCFGFAFWSLGLVAVKYFRVSSQPVNYSRLVSYLFLLLCLPFLYFLKEKIYFFSQHNLKHYTDFIYDGNINHWFKIAFSLHDLAYMPFCFMGVLLFSGRTFPYQKLVLWLLQLVPAYTLFLLYQAGGAVPVKKLIFPISCYAVSCWMLVVDFPLQKKIATAITGGLIWMGNISYGTYLTHIPVLMAFHKVHFFTGTPVTFAVRMVLYFATTYALAYFLENNYQRWVVKLSQNKPALQLRQRLKYVWAERVVKNSKPVPAENRQE